MQEALRRHVLTVTSVAACLAATAASPQVLPTLKLSTALSSAEKAAAEPDLIPLILTVRLNQVNKGEHGAYLRGEDDFLLPRALLAQWLPNVTLPASLTVEGEEQVPVRQVTGARVRFDEQRLVLFIDLPPEAFAAQSMRYLASDRPAPSTYAGLSAIVNYQLAASGPVSGEGSQILSAAVEAVVRRREWLLRGALYQSQAASEATSGRGLTYLAREDPFALTRLTLGDFNTGSSEVSGGVVLGGISFARALELDPYTVRQPGATIRETVDMPSTIDVYVGDNRILRQAVGPGPVDISNLTYLAGRRDIRIVVRDALGHERETTFPFYFADRGLAAGVHDYNYGLGVVRRDLSSLRGSYGNLMLAAFHRAGLNNVVTAGAELKATRDIGNAGPGITLRLDRFGIVSLAALASYDRVRERTGGAAALGYTFLGHRWSGGLFARAASRDFTPVGTAGDGQPPSLSDVGVSFSYTTPGFGTFTVSASERRPRLEGRTRSASVGYSYTINRWWQLQALWRRSDGPRSEREALLSLQYSDGSHLGRATYRENNDQDMALVSFGTYQPVGEGFGYTVTGESVRSPEGNRQTLTPEFLWNTPYASVQGSVIQTKDTAAGSTQAYQVALNGSLAAVGGQVGFSRAAEDAFAVVRIVPPLEGVRVYLNEQAMGRTGPLGRLFLPRLVSSIANGITIDVRDLPIERSLDRRVASVVPWPRGGVVVDFEAPLRLSVEGVFLHDQRGSWRPLANGVVKVAGPAGEIEVQTGQAGEFYFEHLPPGEHRATLHFEGRRCEFTLRVPQSDEPQLRLADVRTCAPS